MNAAAFELREVHAWLGHGPRRKQVLHGVTLTFAAGRWTAVVGPNGAGKSTLLRVLAGLLPHEGQVALHGRMLGAIAARERARLVAWLGQNENAADDLAVEDVVMLGRLPHQGWLAAPGEADRAAVAWALGATQTAPWRARTLGELSGGERQRVLLARALAVQAGVLLMDEPLANLDPPHQADFLALVRQLTQAGHTVVSVLHEIPMALQADALVVMNRGHVVHQGACAEASTHRALEAVFGHRIRVKSVDGQWITVPV